MTELNFYRFFDTKYVVRLRWKTSYSVTEYWDAVALSSGWAVRYREKSPSFHVMLYN